MRGTIAEHVVQLDEGGDDANQGAGPAVRARRTEKSILQVGLSVALLVFAFLAFGQTATKQYAGTAELYTYFGVTVVILILVSLLPPNRPDRWLGGSRTTA